MNEFRERRMKNERGVTPREVLQSFLEGADDIDEIAIITERGDQVEVYYSTSEALKVIGLLETAKVNVITDWIE